MLLRSILRSTTALVTTLAIGAVFSPARAADPMDTYVPAPAAGSLPAVSGVNGKLEFSVGGLRPGYEDNPVILRLNPGFNDFSEGYKVKGAVSVPLSHSFGAQFDGAIGSLHDEVYGHAGAHLFWRDPAVGLIGGYGSWTVWDSVNAYRIGAEGEYYYDNVTGGGVVGYEWGDVDDGLFTIADLDFYAMDDLMLTVGHRFAEEVGHSFAASAEYQFHSTENIGMAAYVDGRLGEDDYQSIFAGIRLYFGDNKSLIRRHREDDPKFRDEPNSVFSCENETDMVAPDSILTGQQPCNIPFERYVPVE